MSDIDERQLRQAVYLGCKDALGPDTVTAEQARKQRVIETARALFVDAVYTPATCIKAAEEFEQAAEKYLKGEK